MRSVMRFGRSIPADEVFEAWTSRDLDRMRAAVGLQTNAVDRHCLLSVLVRVLYRERAEPGVLDELHRHATQHIRELPDLLVAMRCHEALGREARAAKMRTRGQFEDAAATEAIEPVDPYVETDSLANTALCQAGRFDDAITMWQIAHSVGYINDDGLSWHHADIEKRRKRASNPAQQH